MRTVLISPHDDDSVLFAAFTLLRTKCDVVVVFDSYVQAARGIPGCTAAERAAETERAHAILGVPHTLRCGFRDDASPSKDQVCARIWSICGGFADTELIIPAFDPDGHPQHNRVAMALDRQKDLAYVTYNKYGKVSTAQESLWDCSGEWISLKLRAMAEFRSQFDPRTGCVEHFIGRSLREYYA